LKKDIHPNYVDCTITCACGNVFQTRSTLPKIHVEICSACHPFYTGKQKLVDTAGRIERYRKRYAKMETAPKEDAKKEPAPKAEKAAVPKAEKAAVPKVEKVSVPKVEKVTAPKAEIEPAPKVEKVTAPKAEMEPAPNVETEPLPKPEN